MYCCDIFSDLEQSLYTGVYDPYNSLSDGLRCCNPIVGDLRMTKYPYPLLQWCYCYRTESRLTRLLLMNLPVDIKAEFTCRHQSCDEEPDRFQRQRWKWRHGVFVYTVTNKNHFVDGELLYQFRMNFRRRRRLMELLADHCRTIPENQDSPFCLRKQNADRRNTSFLSGKPASWPISKGCSISTNAPPFQI